jgi:hypothetical protein
MRHVRTTGVAILSSHDVKNYNSQTKHVKLD